MKTNKLNLSIVLILFLCSISSLTNGQNQSAWQSLFDGRTLNGWTANEKTDVFSLANGTIVVKGGRSHLFYTGNVLNADFRNFELKADVMTEPGTNSGIFIHTKFQNEGWLQNGNEIQINNSSPDPQKTGGIFNTYAIEESPVKDNEWFTMDIIVEGPHVIVKVNGTTVTDYTEQDTQKPLNIFTNGTIAIQGHSEGSVTYLKNIQIRAIN